MSRISLSKKQVQGLLAKGKQRRTQIQEEAELEKNIPVRHKPAQRVSDNRVAGGELRGVIEATFLRVYEEMYPQGGLNHTEIQEEAYITVLAMVVGRDDYTPRKGLTIREAEISDNAKFCKKHQ